MNRTALPAPSPELQQVLDWLTSPGADDPLLDLLPLRNHVVTINALERPALHRLKIAELLQFRAEQIDDTLHPLLLDAKLPLPEHLAKIAQGLIDLRAELGSTWLAIARDIDPAELQRVHRNSLQICLRGLDNFSRQLVASLLVASPAPAGLWRNTQALYHQAIEGVDPTATYPAEMALIEVRLKAMLALAAAQPEGLTPRELAFLASYLVDHAVALQMSPLAPTTTENWLWIETSEDQPPVTLARRTPASGQPLFFHCQDLADLAGKELAQLAEGATPSSLGLPIQAAGSDYRNALERARQCWMAPRKRSYNRKKKVAGTENVEVCIHLGSLWEALCGTTHEKPASEKTDVTMSGWGLLNEGPAGYALMHISGAVEGIVPGCAIGIRTGAHAAWQICLVRWARNESREHIALGIEVMAPHAQAIRIQPDGHRQQSPVAALLLPPLPAINRGEAILAARGEYNLRPFTLLHERDGRLQIVECTPGRSIAETSSVEIFEFQRQST
jgi:hypothetical protein